MPRHQQVTVLPGAIRAWRRERNMSQAALAAATKHQISEGLVAQIETGRRQPGLVNALAIARALGIDLDAVAIVHVSPDELARATEAAA